MKITCNHCKKQFGSGAADGFSGMLTAMGCEQIDALIVCPYCGEPNQVTIDAKEDDDGEFRCDICGVKLIPCDESPWYGKSWLHPENSCVKAGLWWGLDK